MNLCKTLLSAAVAGYPTPTIINWGVVFDDPTLVAGGSHLGKIKGVSRWLNTLPSERNQDLVLVVDAYDVWFHLRPDVLLQRYHDINRQANARIRARMGKAMQLEQIQQTVVFSAQKRSWPWTDDDPAAYAVPQSTLPAHVYGPETDVISEEPLPFQKVRQRYLNSGNFMGPVGDLKRLFNHSLELAEHDRDQIGSDQKIFAGIFGAQEYEREVIRWRHRPRSVRVMHSVKSFFGRGEETILDPHPTRRRPQALPGRQREFGIGLDYWSLLGHPTVFAEEDSAWVSYNDTGSLELQRQIEEYRVTSPHVKDLPKDIADSRPPFWTHTKPRDLPHPELNWGNVPLYSNLWTGVVPALIHHNAHRDNLKTLRETVWHKMWYQPYARALLNASVLDPRAAVASAVYPLAPLTAASLDRLPPGPAPFPAKNHARIQHARTTYWGRDGRRGGAVKDRWDASKGEADWLSWNELCGSNESAREVFRDGHGPWKDPREDERERLQAAMEKENARPPAEGKPEEKLEQSPEGTPSPAEGKPPENLGPESTDQKGSLEWSLHLKSRNPKPRSPIPKGSLGRSRTILRATKMYTFCPSTPPKPKHRLRMPTCTPAKAKHLRTSCHGDEHERRWRRETSEDGVPRRGVELPVRCGRPQDLLMVTYKGFDYVCKRGQDAPSG